MFTGIIDAIGYIKEIYKSKDSAVLSIYTPWDMNDINIGESISVNGICQTVISKSKNSFKVELSPETMERTTAKNWGVGFQVNLERALRLTDRLSGHFVTGHVDGIGKIESIKREENFTFFEISVPPSLSKYIVEKGSIAVDGISLTVNKSFNDIFSVCVIPHTAKMTTLQFKKIGDILNIENDIIGKYVEKFINKRNDSRITYEFLSSYGFIK